MKDFMGTEMHTFLGMYNNFRSNRDTQKSNENSIENLQRSFNDVLQFNNSTPN